MGREENQWSQISKPKTNYCQPKQITPTNSPSPIMVTFNMCWTPIIKEDIPTKNGLLPCGAKKCQYGDEQRSNMKGTNSTLLAKRKKYTSSNEQTQWILSLRVFGLLSSSLLLFPQCFGQYILWPSSGVCWTWEPTQNFELRHLLNPRGLPVLILLAITGYKC